LVITKLPVEKKAKPRVCAYVRVSTNKEEQEDSFAAQSAYWDGKFKNNPEVEYVGLFTDDGISGKHMKNRKGLNALIEKVRNGEIDAVYTKSISRFARNYTEITAVIREFRDMCVPIIFEKESINTLDPTSGLILSVMASLAEEELNSMSMNQSWAIRKKFAKGEMQLVRINGYDKKDGKLIIDPERAEVVKHIYELYLEGNGVVKICNILEREGCKTLLGKSKWCKSAVSSILRNEKYIGDCLLQKTYCNLNGQYKNDGILPKYYVEDTHEAIISREIYEQVQKMRQENVARYHPGNTEKRFYPLSAKIICGNCGATYSRKTCAKGTSYASIKWSCRTKDQQTKAACDSHDIKDDVITKLFIEAYNECVDSKFESSDVANEEEKLRLLLQTEKELKELHIKGYISDIRYREETEKLLGRIEEQEKTVRALKSRTVNVKKLEKSAELTQSMADFLIKATVKDWMVTFEFANGYTVTKSYTNGRAGNVNGKLCKHKA